MIDHHFSDLNNHLGANPNFQQKESFHNPTSIGDTVAHPKALQPVKPWQKQRANKELTMGKKCGFKGIWQAQIVIWWDLYTGDLMGHCKV